MSDNYHPEDNIAELKRAMREKILRIRSGITDVKRREASREIIAKFMGEIPLEKNDRVAGYWPVSGEVDIKILLEILHEERHIVSLPCVISEEEPLSFRQWLPGMHLHINSRFGTYEPEKTAKIVNPNIVIVPLLAFDAAGYRLGFGKGFYDRTIAAMKETRSDILFAGVAYDAQQVPLVPRNEHDQKLDCVVTERRVVIFDRK